jgi:hypothetical protein
MAEELSKEKIQEAFTQLILQLGEKRWNEHIAKLNQDEIISEILKLNKAANEQDKKKPDSETDAPKSVVPEILQ